jgi:hypothetical protein
VTEQPADQPPPGYQVPPGYEPPSGYGQPGYGPPGYGAPGYGYPPQPGWGPPTRRTNTLAIIALVSVFVFAPAALVLGIIARNQIRETGEDGDGMALAAVICGAIAVAFSVILIGAFLLVLGAAVSTGLEFVPR